MIVFDGFELIGTILLLCAVFIYIVMGCMKSGSNADDDMGYDRYIEDEEDSRDDKE